MSQVQDSQLHDFSNGEVVTEQMLDQNFDVLQVAINDTDTKVNTISAAGAVGTQNIADNAVTTAKIAANAVTTAKVADSSITTAKVADSGITTAKVADANITNAKIATGTITEDKLVTGTLDIRYYTESEIDSKLNLKANIASPTFTGTVTVPTPATDGSAATKLYVDGSVATLDGNLTATIGTKVSKSGDTMTGALTLSGNPVNTNHAANKSYVDTQDALKVSKAGDTMTGALTLSGNPTTNLHAAPKQYVDSQIANLIASAPGALDTLNELATALGNDPNFATTMTNQLALKAPLASPTFTGTVTVPAPTNGTDAATKTYVDNLGALKAPINNPTFTGSVAFNGAVDFNNNQAVEFVVENISSAPVSPIEGRIYYNTADKKYYGYKGAAIGWVDLSGRGAVVRDKEFTATSGQTVFDLTSAGVYATGTNTIFVFKNGALMREGDYTETNSTTITLTSGASTGDIIFIRWFENDPALLGDFFLKDGSVAMTGNLNLNSNRIVNLATPTTNTDAATKAYVDAKVTKAGDTMTGKLTVNASLNGDVLGHIINSNASGFGFKVTNTSTTNAAIAVSGADYVNKIELFADGKASFVGEVAVATPTVTGSAATKGYVDTQVATKQASNANLTAIAGGGSWNTGTTAPTGTTRLNYEGYLYATKIYNAIYNDYAEYFEKDDTTLEPGDVVAVNPDGDGYIKSQKEYDTLVVGVYSDDCGMVIGGNGDENDEQNFASVGMAGRVRVKVTGEVKKGDLLVSSAIPGVAMKGNFAGCVIAKALEDHTGEEVHRIKALILNA